MNYCCRFYHFSLFASTLTTEVALKWPSSVIAIFQVGSGALIRLRISNDRLIINSDVLSYTEADHPSHSSVYMVTYLVSNQTGNHTIFGNCSSSFSFYIHLLDGYSHASTSGSRQVSFSKYIDCQSNV